MINNLHKVLTRMASTRMALTANPPTAMPSPLARRNTLSMKAHMPMKTPFTLAACCCAALLLLTPLRLMAGGDHDHGPAAASAQPAAAWPRFAAVSDLFELVGVLQGQRLTLYLDRAADNSPVTEAQIELEVAGQKFNATRLADGSFEVMLPAAPPPGVSGISATVTAGTGAALVADLLAGELDLHTDEHGDGPAEAANAAWWRGGGGLGMVWAALAGLLAGAMGATLGRRAWQRRSGPRPVPMSAPAAAASSQVGGAA